MTMEDPYNQVNLAGQHAYRKIEKKLARELTKWMEYSGDEGMATELMSFERMNRFKADGIYLIDEFLEPSTSDFHDASASFNLEVPVKGYYTFYIEGKGSLHVNDQLLIESRPGGNDRNNERYGVIALKKGMHRLEIRDDDANTLLKWSGPAIKKSNLDLN